MAKNLKTMSLHDLEMERFDARERLVYANGLAKKDLNKYLARLNDEIGRKRKLND